MAGFSAENLNNGHNSVRQNDSQTTGSKDADRQNTDRLIAEAFKPSPIGGNLRRLTDEVGGRVPGTLAFRQAVNWGLAAIKDAGADSVHTEEFRIQKSWAEGATEMVASLDAGE